jgi:glycosyltransferase involved in cell wall biosynthesis
VRVLELASGDAWGGAEQVIKSLCEGLVRRGDVDVRAVTLTDGRLAEELRRLSIPVETIDESRYSLAEVIWRVRALARGVDVIHAHRYKEFVIGAGAVFLSGRALVATIHGLEPAQEIGCARSAAIWGSVALARLSGGRLVCVSRELESRARLIVGARRVTRISNPVPRRVRCGVRVGLRDHLGWGADLPVIGFVGRLERVKGPDRLIDAACAMSREAGIVFIGAGSMRGELEAAARASRLADRIRFIGEVPDGQAYIAELTVLALPSRHEGVPLVALEAALSRVPVVAFDVGGVREVLDDPEATSVVPAGDVGAFARALDVWIGSAANRAGRLERWARAVEGRFSLDAVSSAYVDVFHAASARRRRKPKPLW